MKINELIEMYNKNPRIDLEKKLEVTKYVSIVHKRDMANLILDNCISVVDGEIHIDSIERYLLFMISVIGIHTNLEFFDEEDEDYSAINDYDLLCESGLLVKIIDTFKDDYASCQEILNMVTSDRLQENMTFEKRVSQFLDAVIEMLSDATNTLVEKLDVDAIKQLDQEKMMQLYNFIGKQ